MIRKFPFPTHVELVHILPVPQVVPHPPQFVALVALVVVSVQIPEHVAMQVVHILLDVAVGVAICVWVLVQVLTERHIRSVVGVTGAN